MFLIVAALILTYAAFQIWGTQAAIAVAVVSSFVGLLMIVYSDD